MHTNARMTSRVGYCLLVYVSVCDLKHVHQVHRIVVFFVHIPLRICNHVRVCVCSLCS